MKITNNLDPRQVADLYFRLAKTKKSPDSQKNDLPAADSLEISSRARELQIYRASLKELPEVRTRLVESVRRELAEGSYHSDARAIAAGILEEHRLDQLV